MSAYAWELGPALLFCPADRPDRYDKAAQRSDAVILDLEDAVDPASKAAAREALVVHGLDPARTIVRVNAADSGELGADLVALARTPYRTIMLAKTEHAQNLSALDGYDVIALCETAAGVLNAPAIAAHASVVALMWGAEDLVASLGGSSSRHVDGGYRDIARHARSSVLLSARANGKAAIDAVHLDIHDTAGLAAEAADAAASGFQASACIHPSQVEVIRNAYRPSESEVEAALELLAAARDHPGVFQHRGRMIDEPVLRHARQLIERARR